jgi:hypothetical protein
MLEDKLDGYGEGLRIGTSDRDRVDGEFLRL